MGESSQGIPKQDIRNYLSSLPWLAILVVAILVVLVAIFVVDSKNSIKNNDKNAVPTVSSNKGKFNVQNKAIVEYGEEFMLDQFQPSGEQVIEGKMAQAKGNKTPNQKIPYQKKIIVGGVEFTFFAKEDTSGSVSKVGAIRDIENGKTDLPSIVSYFKDYFIMPVNIGEEFWDKSKAPNGNVSYKLVYDNSDGSKNIKLAKQISDKSISPDPIIRLISCNVSPNEVGYTQESCFPSETAGKN